MLNHLLIHFNILIRVLKLVIQPREPGSAKHKRPQTRDCRHLNRNGPSSAACHCTQLNVSVFEMIVLFTPQDPLCFLSNGALVRHIWVNRLNSFTSLNEHINKELLFCSVPKVRHRLMKPHENYSHFYIGACCIIQ